MTNGFTRMHWFKWCVARLRNEGAALAFPANAAYEGGADADLATPAGNGITLLCLPRSGPPRQLDRNSRKLWRT